MSLLAAVDSLRGILGLGGSSDFTVRNLFRFGGEWEVDTAAATNTAIAEQVAFRVKQKARLVGVWFNPAAAVTGAATNFFTLNVRKRLASAPATSSLLIAYAASSTPAGDAAAFGSKDLYTSTYIQAAGGVPDSTFDFVEGDVLTMEVTKASAGMTFPISCTSFVFEARD